MTRHTVHRQLSTQVQHKTMNKTNIRQSIQSRLRNTRVTGPNTTQRFLTNVPAHIGNNSRPLKMCANIRTRAIGTNHRAVSPYVSIFNRFVVTSTRRTLTYNILFNLTRRAIDLFDDTQHLIRNNMNIRPFRFASRAKFIRVCTGPTNHNKVRPSTIRIHTKRNRQLFTNRNIGYNRYKLLIINPRQIARSRTRRRNV